MKKGFTLVELIVVIAIVAVLGLFITPRVQGYLDSSKEVVCTRNINELEQDYQLNEALTSEVISKDEFLLTKTNITCPDGGIYFINGNQMIVCSKHGGNRLYNEERLTDTMYNYGDIIEVDGLMYRTLAEVNNQDFANEDVFRKYFIVLGSNDSRAIDYDKVINRRLEVGTLINKDGKVYMYTPYYNNNGAAVLGTTEYFQANFQEFKPNEMHLAPKLNYTNNKVINMPGLNNDGTANHVAKNTVFNIYQNKYRVVDDYVVQSQDPMEDLQQGLKDQTIVFENDGIYRGTGSAYKLHDKVWYQGHYYEATNQQLIVTSNTTPNVPGNNNPNWRLIE